MVDRVAVADAVLGPQILVLPVVILDRDVEPRGRIAELEERDVVAAAAEAVGAPDLANVEADIQPVGEAVEEARDVARRRVILAAEAVGRGHELDLALRARAFGQHARMGGIAHAVGAQVLPMMSLLRSVTTFQPCAFA